MTSVIDIISAVVSAMKPSLSSAILLANSTYGVSASGLSDLTLTKLFVGEKIKLTYTGGTVVYGEVYSINFDTNKAIIQIDPILKVPPTSIEVVLSFHYGHRIEVVNIFKEITRAPTHKKEMFPAVCLFTDITERITNDGTERECELNVVIMTDTQPKFTAADRKLYSFDPILQPLYELFMERLARSTSILEVLPDHEKTDRYFWGKTGLYGNEGNIFNDYIDAIEIDKLKIKTLKTC